MPKSGDLLSTEEAAWRPWCPAGVTLALWPLALPAFLPFFSGKLPLRGWEAAELLTLSQDVSENCLQGLREGSVTLVTIATDALITHADGSPLFNNILNH